MSIEYSAIRIRVTPKPPYSILNPETSSSSPLEKSKGVRLVSATDDTSHRIKRKGQTQNDKYLLIILDNILTDKDLHRSGTLRTISASLIS